MAKASNWEKHKVKGFDFSVHDHRFSFDADFVV